MGVNLLSNILQIFWIIESYVVFFNHNNRPDLIHEIKHTLIHTMYLNVYYVEIGQAVTVSYLEKGSMKNPSWR